MKLIIAWIIVTLTALGCLAVFISALVDKLMNWKEWIFDAIAITVLLSGIALLFWAISVVSE